MGGAFYINIAINWRNAMTCNSTQYQIYNLIIYFYEFKRNQNMLKFFSKTILILSILCGIHQTQAQTFAQRSEISVGPEIGIPLGDFKDDFKVGIGGSVKYAFAIDNIYGLTLQTGYL